MPNFYKYITLLSLLGMAIMLQGCDEISEQDRYIELPPITADRAVLLEDFTGQNCVNCPDAHDVMTELVNQYGPDKVVAVSIHCGDFGISVKRTNFDKNYIGLMSEEGNAINSAYGINQWPMGVVDMGQPLTVDQWSGAVREALMTPSDVTLQASADVTATDVINIEAHVQSSLYVDASIQFWIVEDGIVARQRSSQGLISDYIHNNVFRAMVFSPEGKSISLTREGVTVNGEIAVRNNEHERWNIDNLSVVAFVFDKSGVRQVTKVPVK